MEVARTCAASTNSRTPVMRAACFSAFSGSTCTLNRHRTAIAESSSIALSPPNAKRAGLSAFQAEVSDIAASMVIQAIVIVWMRWMRRTMYCCEIAEGEAIGALWHVQEPRS